VENERARIARDIHDDLGSSLTEINLLSALALRDATPLSECKTQVTRIMARAQELSQTLDETVWALNPRNDWLKRLATYMCHFAKEFLEPTPIRCRLEIADDLPDFPLSADARHNIYLLVKEALNNAVRHSGATEVELRMRTGAEHFVLQIADNGRGLEFEETDATGNGLRNMAQRAEQAGGEFALTGKPGAGTTVTFKLRVPPNTTQSPAASRVVPTQTGDPATGSSP
jgi:signal transduction histidine kinase